ncbi:hypothetical protein CC85DRAFT_300870 [Cutaneotrichosporon oleaginosum]|uniref:CENP-V/GFA domain-containing protein n=1 Tax=Cutaneotrichosporon oleaginosum TaxID=879819 RepID=A0A0J0XS95_9TREE|nr:uncharacterized protein CC85DRAFT_300870 [Cutaneotrichosporon oleaginosum]KLT43948.1 hypothetical protein CC85DRAFT_300870 [Cutaneotrichosporon oleaginosum]TXT04105.1 hypothetical protein COLE_07802 [Cutaneotrichosporon oleaginosum]
MTRSGSCRCGAITIDFLDDSNNDGVVCYCKSCRSLHSSESLNLKTEVDKVKVTKGTPKVYKDSKTDSGKAINRNFCGDCGSALFSDPDAMPGVRFLKVGALDDASAIKIVGEIYVDDALKFQVRDKKHGQKQFEGMMAKEV